MFQSLFRSILGKLLCRSFKLAYLYKVVEQTQRNDDGGEDRCSQADHKECSQHTQQTQDPRAQ